MSKWVIALDSGSGTVGYIELNLLLSGKLEDAAIFKNKYLVDTMVDDCHDYWKLEPGYSFIAVEVLCHPTL